MKEINISNLKGNNEIILMKVAYESSDKKNIFKNSWLEMIRILINSKRFNLLVNTEIQDLAIKLKYMNLSHYNLLSIELKILLIEFLINSAYETSIIREKIKKEIRKKNDLKKEKLSLQLELKNKELRKREIKSSHDFLDAQTKIDFLNKKIIEIDENSIYSRIVINRNKKELDIERERYISV